MLERREVTQPWRALWEAEVSIALFSPLYYHLIACIAKMKLSVYAHQVHLKLPRLLPCQDICSDSFEAPQSNLIRKTNPSNWPHSRRLDNSITLLDTKETTGLSSRLVEHARGGYIIKMPGLLGKKFPTPIGKAPIANTHIQRSVTAYLTSLQHGRYGPFYTAGIVILYGINSAAAAMMQCKSPSNPTSEGSHSPQWAAMGQKRTFKQLLT